MYAKALVLSEVRVRQQNGPITLGIVLLEHGQTALSLVVASLSRVQQEQVIPRLVVMFVVGILRSQTAQCLLAKRQVVELVLEDDARMEQTVFDEVVALGQLLFGKRYLCQIVFALMRVESSAVGRFLRLLRIGLAVSGCAVALSSRLAILRTRRVISILRTLCVFCAEVYDGLVDALPVIFVLAPTPQSLEVLLTLTDGLRIIEIPQSRLAFGCRRGYRWLSGSVGSVGSVGFVGTLLPFVVNESEFRIPCIGNALQHDDISSMSAAQKSMISMIISFSLLKQSSTNYNIISIDEIDGALDSYNRAYFINLLDNLMRMLNCEQAFMISHNSELNTSDCDIILLKDSSNDIMRGNVIWKY